MHRHSTVLRFAAALSGGALLCAGVHLLAQPHQPTLRSESTRAFVLAVSFVGLAFAELRTYLSTRAFGAAVVRALLRTLISVPLIAVGAAFCFLILGSILSLEVLGGPDNATLLNGPIYVGVLYGPFASLYWHTKAQILKQIDTVGRANRPVTRKHKGRRQTHRDSARVAVVEAATRDGIKCMGTLWSSRRSALLGTKENVLPV